MNFKPSLHQDYQINDRVKCKVSNVIEGQGLISSCTGTIVGIAAQHIIHHYIILLDEPMMVPGYDKPWRAIVYPGGADMQKI